MHSFRAVRATAAIVLASLLALVVCAATAHAAPLSMTFTEGRANVGDQLSVTDYEDALFRAPDTAPFQAQMDAGLITAGSLAVPDFETFITDPIDANVTVEFDIGAISGSFDQATGALTLSGTAGGTLTAEGGACTVSTIPSVLTLTTAGSTGGSSPFSGTPFIGGLTGAGAIAGQWTHMDATPVTEGDASFCNNVEQHIGGPGGVWLEHAGDIVPPRRITAGGYHSCLIKADDTPVCWSGASAVPAGIGTVSQIAAGGLHTCAIKTDGTPVCWGNDDDEQSTVPGDVDTVTQIAAGGAHTCAVKTDRIPVCWGDGEWGQSTVPVDIGTVRQIDAGLEHTCAVKTDGTPVCWGDDFFGQVAIPGGVGKVRQITVGEGHTCAIETDGAPVCWGADDNHQASVPSGIGTVKQIDAGGLHTCAIKTNGTPVCWGREAPSGYPHPTLPSDIGTVSEIAGGDWHSCAIKTDGIPICWGSHIAGQLGGSPAFASSSPPSLVGVGPFSHSYLLVPRFDDMPVRFVVSSGTLPPGLTLNETTGALSGTPTTDGVYTGVVSATNDVFSPGTQPFSITVDTTAPATPSGLTPSPASPSSNLQPRIVGTADVGSTVRVYDSETCTGSPRATGGAGTFASPGLQIAVAAGSTTTVYATATDAAGNVSACSTSKAIYAHAEDPVVDPGTPTNPGTGTGEQPAAIPPNTVLRKHPRAKVTTKKAKVKVTFKFSSKTGTRFQCKLDKKRFSACGSPKSYRVSPGKHRFSVRAVRAGATDATPATFRFEVLKKKR